MEGHRRSLATLLFLLSVAFAEGQGAPGSGNPGGGTTTSGWVVEYKGEIKKLQNGAASGTVWTSAMWTTNGPTGGYVANGSAGTCSLDGTLSIRVRWSDPQTAPIGVASLVLQAGMVAQGVHTATVSARDGVNPTLAGTYLASVGGKRLVQVGATAEKTVDLVILGKVNGPPGYAGSVSWEFAAGLDTRYARATCAELGSYSVRSATSTTADYSLPDLTWDGATTATVVYTKHEVEPANPLTMSGTTLVDRRIVGLPTGLYECFGGNHSSDHRALSALQILTIGGFLSYRDPSTSYSLQSSKGGSVSGTLPDANGSVAVPPLPPATLVGGDLTVTKDLTWNKASDLSYAPTTEGGLLATLAASWPDGVSAEGQLQLTFMDEYANEKRFGPAEITTSQSPVGYVFEDGSGRAPLHAGRPARKIKFNNNGQLFRAAQGSVAVLGGALATQPGTASAAVVLSLVGAILSLGDVKPDEGMLQPPDPFTKETSKLKIVLLWTDMDENAQKRWRDTQAAGGDMSALYNQSTWSAEYLPFQAKSLSVRDHYDLSGYRGQGIVVRDVSLPAQLAPCKRFTFRLSQMP